MDTKLKKYSSVGNRLLFGICVISFLGAIAGAVYALMLHSNSWELYDGNLWYLLAPGEFDAQRVLDLWESHGDLLYDIRTEMLIFLGMTGGLGILCLGSLIVLLVRTTGPAAGGTVPLRQTDRWWTEIQLFLLIAAAGAGGIAFLRIFAAAAERTRWVGLYDPDGFYTGDAYPVQLLYGAALAIGLTAAGLGLWMLLSLVRKTRAGKLLSCSFFGLILFEPVKKLYYGSGVMRKVVLITLAAALLSMTVVGAPVVMILVLVLGPRHVSKFEAIKEGVRQVNEGNLTYQIPTDPSSSSELDSLGKNINRIFESSNRAVQNEIRNQRMKTELISSVSHDLRTPLTSIITYLDLLKSEDLNNQRASEYLEVLEQKAFRLKQLTDDLFEAAKASSGTLPVEFATVELMSLVRQTLGEFDRRIADSRLEFIVAPAEKHYVRADGQLLYRVMENLVGNALKYAMPGTRVYIDVFTRPDNEAPGAEVFMQMKNVSSQPLNIGANELMERFKRGDESRTTDGSGLGLAIAKDLLKLQNGRLDIVIDGDLFKATAVLKAAETPASEIENGPSEEEEPEGDAEDGRDQER